MNPIFKKKSTLNYLEVEPSSFTNTLEVLYKLEIFLFFFVF